MASEARWRVAGNCGQLLPISAARAISRRSADEAANLTPLVSFNGGDGSNPVGAGVIMDAKGNLFGTTFSGGAHGGGTVFEIAKTAEGYASTPTVLYSFCLLPNCADGQGPNGSLIFDAKGNLFGTTFGGGLSVGPSGGGTVFEIVKTAHGYASTLTTLIHFNTATGTGPSAGLIADGKGNLFGTTANSGPNDGQGTVFEIVKTAHGYASTPTVLVTFIGTNGGGSFAPVIADAHGNLFGTTFFGGANNKGVVFEIVKTAHGYASTPTVLYSFCSLSNCADGAGPEAGLIIDTKGNLFGTTTGDLVNAGTVFEIARTADGYASTPTTLVTFFCAPGNCGDGDRPGPRAGLIADPRGNLFGTTFNGGANGDGTVFKIAKTADGYASTPTTLADFDGSDGANPWGDLLADAKGTLFGTTNVGGANNRGTVFEVTDSGFIIFAGTPGKPNCFGQSVAALARQYGGLNAAAEALGYPSVRALQKAILEFCEPDEAAEHRKNNAGQSNSISP